MAASPSSLSLSLDSTLKTFLSHFSSLSHPSPPASVAFPVSTATHSPSPAISLSLKFLHHISSLPRSYSYEPSPVDIPAPQPESTPSTSTFLDGNGLRMLETLKNFRLFFDLEHGSLEIRRMERIELDATVQLLAESFGESMWLPPNSIPLLAYLVKQYVEERRRLVPHMAFLVGFYREKGDGGAAKLACTAEISFDAIGANAAPPTPIPPRECPYICNMTVEKTLRRKKIGGHLLMACEELITQMKVERTVYLHCRVIDEIPFSMYKKANYRVVKKDSILIWLTLQRRKRLMCKQLPPVPDEVSPSDNVDCDDQTVSVNCD